MKVSKKITYVESKKHIDYRTGEVTQEHNTTQMTLPKEPSYIKLYIDCLLTFRELSKSLNPILFEFLKYMTYASTDDELGGQVIYANAHMKRNIAKSLQISPKRIESALTDFVKSGIFKRIATSTYQVNPSMFGRGEWKDIRYIRAQFDFNRGLVEAEITTGDEVELRVIKE